MVKVDLRDLIKNVSNGLLGLTGHGLKRSSFRFYIASSKEYSGSEVMLTIFQTLDKSEKQFAEDVDMVERDLKPKKYNGRG